MTHPTQMTCPYCLGADAFVRRVTVDKDDMRTFTFKCDSCHRSWDGEAHTETSNYQLLEIDPLPSDSAREPTR